MLDGGSRDHSIQALGQVPVYVSAGTGVCMIFWWRSFYKLPCSVLVLIKTSAAAFTLLAIHKLSSSSPSGHEEHSSPLTSTTYIFLENYNYAFFYISVYCTTQVGFLQPSLISFIFIICYHSQIGVTYMHYEILYSVWLQIMPRS